MLLGLDVTENDCVVLHVLLVAFVAACLAELEHIRRRL